MRKIHVFNNASVDGFFTDASGDMSWAHKRDEEWNAFASGNASGSGELLFGRVTYDMMASFRPTQQAAQMLPKVAAGMNAMRKTVFTRTLHKAAWENTTLVKGDLVAEVRKLKQQSGPDSQAGEYRTRHQCELVSLNPVLSADKRKRAVLKGTARSKHLLRDYRRNMPCMPSCAMRVRSKTGGAGRYGYCTRSALVPPSNRASAKIGLCTPNEPSPCWICAAR